MLCQTDENLKMGMIAAFLNVIMQELLVRGYLYQMLKQKHNIGNEILSGGACKIEGSIFVLIVNIVLTVLFVLLNSKKKSNNS